MKSLLLVMCLIPAAQSGESLPEPAGRVAYTVRPVSDGAGTPGRLLAERAVWLRKDSTRTFILLVGACGMCLLGLEWRVRRRSNGSQQRQASALAGALRGGALEFEGGPSSGIPVWTYAHDDSEEHRCLLPARINHSRYELLSYQETSGDLQEPVVTISYLGGGSDPDSLIRDEDLLLGIPREFLGDAAAETSGPDVERLALTEGSAAGDDPGESVLYGDLT